MLKTNKSTHKTNKELNVSQSCAARTIKKYKETGSAKKKAGRMN